MAGLEKRVEELERSAPRFAPRGVSGGMNQAAVVGQALSAAAAPMTSGRFYYPIGTPSTLLLTLDHLTFVPFTVGRSCTINQILLEVTTVGTAGAVLRAGIYADADGLPGALIVDGGTQIATTVGLKTYTISAPVTAGRIWVASAAQVAACTVRTSSAVEANQVGVAAAPTDLSLGSATVFQAAVTGAFPATATPSATATGSAPVRFALRAT